MANKKKGKIWKLPYGAKIGTEYTGGVLEVLRVYYRSDIWAALLVRDQHDNNFTIVGTNTLCAINPGARISVQGIWVKSKYGLQVDVSKASILSVDESIGFVESLLSHCTAEEKKAIEPFVRLVYSVFGNDTEAALLDRRAFSDARIPTGNLYRGRVLRLISKKRFRDDKMKTLAELHKLGIDAANAEKIQMMFDRDSVDIAKNFPYELAMEMREIPFSTADAIAKSMKISYDPDARMRMAVRYGLDVAASNGHCYVPYDALVEGIGALLQSLDKESDERVRKLQSSIKKAITECETAKIIVKNENRVYSYEMDEIESVVAMNVAVRLYARPHSANDMFPRFPQNEKEMDEIIISSQDHATIVYSDDQVTALRHAITHPVSVITGGPGTGKTTICRAIVRALELCDIRYSLCSPTGRGAKRLEESVDRNASTIHRLLKFNPKFCEWEMNTESQLDVGAVIVDEVSMVDADLLKALFDAMPGVGRVILVGDQDQLPSIGPGRVLRDMIHSGVVPVTVLKQIFRQDDQNSIVQVAQSIKSGEIPNISPVGNEDVGRDGCWMVSRSNPYAVAKTIPRIIRKVADARGISPDNVQVLTPMKQGALGTISLNAILQDELNPPSSKSKSYMSRGRSFRVGDRVMQTKNDYDNDIFNGDMGVVTSVTKNGIVIDFDGRKIVEYYGGQTNGIEHAYAITIHKSQGSEFPVGIIIMHDAHGRMLKRNLLYTAITRCVDQAFIIGQESAIKTAVDDDREQARYTYLSERIRKLSKALTENVINSSGLEWTE